MPDLSHWLTKQEAAAALGVSTKTVEKLAHDGELHQAERARAGRPPLVVYHPDDVERAAAKRTNGAHVMPAAPPAESAVVVSRPLAAFEQLARLLPPAKPEPKLFLTLDEAAEYSGLTVTFLRRAIGEGVMRAIRDRALKIRRADLDAFAREPERP